MISRLLFGEDIFISYSRAEGSTYAAGLADELTRLKFSCFIDQLGTEPDRELPATLKTKIRRSTLLVLVGTPRALASPSVRQEVEEFKKTRRPIVPISFGDIPEDSTPNGVIPGLAVEPENEEALTTGTPSPQVVSRIVKSFNYTRRNERLRRMVWATVASVILLLGGAIWAGAVIIRKANDDAQRARDEAQAGLARAQKAEAEAAKANLEAQTALEQAKNEREQARYEQARRREAELRKR